MDRDNMSKGIDFENVCNSIEELLEIKKISNSVYVLDFKDKAVYALIDSIMGLFGDISKYSEIMNNNLAESILERIIAEKFIRLFGKQDNLFENAIQLKHTTDKGERIYTISRLQLEEWGKGIIYSSIDSKLL